MLLPISLTHSQLFYWKRALARFLWKNHFSTIPQINFVYLLSFYNSILRAVKRLLRDCHAYETLFIDLSDLIKLF